MNHDERARFVFAVVVVDDVMVREGAFQRILVVRA